MKTNTSSSAKTRGANRSAVPYNPSLHNLVEEKKTWSASVTDQGKKPGFEGWRQRGYLPHCDEPGLTQFVTIRLHDSMPLSRRAEWESILKIEDTLERRTKL